VIKIHEEFAGVLRKVAVICLDPSGLCLTTGVPVGSMFNDGLVGPNGRTR
jgi:hypothetical protein